jgi:transcriptional regulator with XRE-family HTH domain
VTSRERAVDRGGLRGRDLTQRIGNEIRNARLDRGLSLRVVSRSAGVSEATLSRIERGLVLSVSVHQLARLCAIVGLELSVRAFPGGEPIRDAAQVSMARVFRPILHPSLRWQTEVPMPDHHDLRAWDGVVGGQRWRYGVEFESAPRDAQAVGRRLQLKARDSGVDGVLLVLGDTEQTRRFLAAASRYLVASFPIAADTALRALREGRDPGGSAIIVLRRAHRRTRGLPEVQESEPREPARPA